MTDNHDHDDREKRGDGDRYRRPPPRAAEPPLDQKELLDTVEPREPLIDPDTVPLDLSDLLSSIATPQVEIRDVRARRLSDGRLTPDKKGRYEFEVGLRHAGVGEHRFGPSPELEMVEFEREEPVRGYPGFLPDHRPLRLVPKRLPERLEAKPRIHVPLDDLDEDVAEPTTVFSPEDRYTFNDTAFPWCTVGRIDTPGGYASGVMVGPRHVLTVSHAIQWNDDGTAGWVKFTPSYFDGSEPFGVAWGTWIYWEGTKVDGSDGIAHPSESRHDYVVVVLNQRMGSLTGWMGSRRYSTSWDDEPYWRHIGYPGDLASGERPSYERDIALDGDSETHMRALHRGDVWPGQSGGPFFAWWSGEDWPRVVSVQSAQTTSDNWASGGDHMVDLVVRARDDFP